MKYGGPAGAQVFLDVLVFHVFVQLVGRLGEAADRGDHADRPAEHGGVPADDGAGPGGLDPGRPAARRRPAGPGRALGLHRAEVGRSATCAWSPPCTCSFPESSSACSRGTGTRQSSRRSPRSSRRCWSCVAIYSLADSVNVTFSFALRGAGDTRFVSLLTFALAWPIMVVPTFAGRPVGRQHLLGVGIRDGVHRRDGRLLLPAVPDRKWKSMRVIEAAAVQPETPAR